ncbi:MAG: fimbria/pilus periplasmic chaperone [Gammaproteobacteria bacterium]|nr:fimbria/pilus periplasmic chaperone [Gammaproteobacteria bacterium]MBU0817463.1 fimbria/pilus periplasmic chaperone [Gammaproteobacteria bacterium]MBU0845125.1 fimbria/pilus periplasmic chaperone [Gammaproteobacteria bacterium]MBU1839862.1 fimbria/pilus periplasmic chaperone [Gammaproteobacteria bacterium]
MSVIPTSKYLLHGLFLVGSLLFVTAQAAIVISGTRVIYPADQREVTIKLDNTGEAPLLIQSWIDDGNPQSTPETSKAPFIMTPPIARVDGHQGQTLRVRYTDQKALPQDKESVFWLNVLEIPPSSSDAQNKLKISFRSRVKLFYRPVGLNIEQDKAAMSMQWRLTKKADIWYLEAFNPSPYYLTISAAKVKNVGAELNLDNSMIPPGERKTLKLNGAFTPTREMQVVFSTVNDYGAVEEFKQPLSE